MASQAGLTQTNAKATVRPAPVLWHHLTAEAVLEQQKSQADGLAADAVAERQRRFGPNVIAGGKVDGPLILFLRQLNSPLLYVLLGSGALALALGKVTDGAVVLGVVFLNAIIGFVQEYRAQKAITALADMVPEAAVVRREGQVRRVLAAEVVPGDIVMLQSGDRVPADLRLLAVKNLQIDEAALTGEAVAVSKQNGGVAEDAQIGDRSSMAFGTTMVTYGTGTGVVVATGNDTELGRISTMLNQTQTLATPLTRAMGKVSLWLTFVILAVTAVLFGVAYWRGFPLADATVAAISLAVAAIPEGLPAIITIALAIGVSRMAKRRVIIRSLPAVETLGSTTVICSDKTGTLTKNAMTVQALWTPQGEYALSGVGYAPKGDLSQNDAKIERAPEDVVALTRAGALCNDAVLCEDTDGTWHIGGDPTEAALCVALRKLGYNDDEERRAFERLDVVPFESERQLMGTLHRSEQGEVFAIIKGAPEVVLQRADSMAGGKPVDKALVRSVIDRLAGRGMRLLAMAQKAMPAEQQELGEQDLERGFVLLGLQGMMDPPREEAILAVAECQAAGITVKMITGDHAGTAAAIGQQLGLQQQGAVVTGTELAKMSEAELLQAAERSHVFARVAPEHKLRLVTALQQMGGIVAMTGDGVNDAPALKRADIGVAMGITGTAVARQASDMVLTDDNFASIVAAVEEGRRVFDNLVKSLAFVLPTNIGEALVIMLAVMFFPIVGGEPEMPILPVQILWVNLVATVALALPLAFEAMEPKLMQRPPRDPKRPILDMFIFLRTSYVAILMTAGAVGLFQYELATRVAQGMARAEAMREAQTMAVTSIVMFQIFYLLACRSIKRGVWAIGLFSNKFVFIGIAAIVLLQLGFVYLPFMGTLFASAPLDLAGWGRTVAVGFVVWPAVGAEKLMRRWWDSRSAKRSAAA